MNKRIFKRYKRKRHKIKYVYNEEFEKEVKLLLNNNKPGAIIPMPGLESFFMKIKRPIYEIRNRRYPVRDNF